MQQRNETHTHTHASADDLQGQASGSSKQEQSEGSKVRTITGLETWTAEEGKRQFEAARPQMLEVGGVLSGPVCGTQSRTELDPQAAAAGRRKQLTSGRMGSS